MQRIKLGWYQAGDLQTMLSTLAELWERGQSGEIRNGEISAKFNKKEVVIDIDIPSRAK